jgi:hypothetical protein
MVTSPGISTKNFYQEFLPSISTKHFYQAFLPSISTNNFYIESHGPGQSSGFLHCNPRGLRAAAHSDRRYGEDDCRQQRADREFVTSRAVSSNAFFSAWR